MAIQRTANSAYTKFKGRDMTVVSNYLGISMIPTVSSPSLIVEANE